jgi:hypothetical protein
MFNKWRKGQNPFRLPLSITFATCQREDKKWISHSLDFDLVSVADTKQEALAKVRLSVITYVEFGLMNNFASDIIFPAPDEYWERLDSKVVEMLPPIEVEDKRILVYGTTLAHELRHAARTA